MVADGFYEWQKLAGRKQPYFIGLQGDRPFGLAGLWERWDKHGAPVESCAILTTDANELRRPIHQRMPAILPPDHYALWLDPRCQDPARLAALLRPTPPRGCWPTGSGPWSTTPKTTCPSASRRSADGRRQITPGAVDLPRVPSRLPPLRQRRLGTSSS